METIKQAGLKKLIREKEFSDPNLQISSILTSDLTAQEIVDSAAVIADTLPLLTEFLDKYGELSEKLEKCEKESKKIEQEKNETGPEPMIFWGVGVAIALYLILEQIVTVQQIIPAIVLLGIVCGLWWLGAKNSATGKTDSLNKAKQNIEPEIKALKQQIDNLAATDILKNATFGVSKLSALIIAAKLLTLADILNKMAVIVDDKDSTASARLLAMENLLYLVKKQEMDEKLLDESKRANDLAEERIKAIQDMENAVNLQTEYQIWQDRGYELGKINAAARLYQKK